MARYVWTYVATAVVMLALDSVWLYVMGARLYQPLLGSLMRDDFDPLAAILFYLIFLTGLVTFVGMPAWDSRRWTETLWRGALFGLVAYATYDLTNQATLRGWSWLVTGADLVWGTALSGLSSVLGLVFAKAFYNSFST